MVTAHDSASLLFMTQIIYALMELAYWISAYLIWTQLAISLVYIFLLAKHVKDYKRHSLGFNFY